MTAKKKITDYPEWERVCKLYLKGYSQRRISRIEGISRKVVKNILEKGMIINRIIPDRNKVYRLNKPQKDKEGFWRNFWKSIWSGIS